MKKMLVGLFLLGLVVSLNSCTKAAENTQNKVDAPTPAPASPNAQNKGDAPTPALLSLNAQNKGDGRVSKLLDEVKLNYLVDKDNDFLVMLKAERIQHVWIRSETASFNQMEIREIWSIAYSSDYPFSTLVKDALLKRNSVIKVGAWSIVPTGYGESIVFRLKIDATLKDAAVLKDAIHFVAITASGVGDELSQGKLWSPF